jgi:hypothetical protein
LWPLAEVVDVPVDEPRSIRQQCTQIHDRIGEMALSIHSQRVFYSGDPHRHVVVFLAVLTTMLP